MRKLLLYCFACIGLLVSQHSNAQIILGTEVTYRGAPREPILISNPNYQQIRNVCQRENRACQCVSVYDLEKISQKYPNIRQYRILTYVSERITGKGNVIYDGKIAEWKKSGYHDPGRWVESEYRIGAYSTEKERGYGMGLDGVPCDYYILTK